LVSDAPIVPVERIERLILFVRGEKVILDAGLATLYGVETGALTRAVRRNIDRFPEDFMFQLTREEAERLRCQIGISNRRGGRRYLPYAFTEHGVAMLSSVLNSPRAVQVNIEIMRASVRMRRMLGEYEELSRKLDAMERNYDAQFKVVFKAIHQLIASPAPPKRRQIGFRTSDEAKQG